MSFGFLGVQAAFGLQQANMSPIYRYLGAEEKNLPILWLAGPVTGLIIQPIIGAISDRTWMPRLGRRRPFFFVGAILTTIALIAMPYSSTVAMAAAIMWILDSAANVTMEPFRAFVADKLPPSQRTLGFSVQSFFVGFGQTLANLTPFILVALGIVAANKVTLSPELEASLPAFLKWFLISPADSGGGGIPDFVRLTFIVGAAIAFISVMYTVFTTDEYPPADIEAFKKEHAGKSIWDGFKEVGAAWKEMPKVMKQLWWVKFFTWYGLPLMWQYLSLSMARHCFNAPTPDSPGFENGVMMGNLGLAVFNIACFGVSFFLPNISKVLTRRGTHAFFLVIGGIGFISMLFTTNPMYVLLCMVLVGLSWASMMAMPYVLLANSVPSNRLGVYMGIFNMFIVIPQIINMVTIPFLYKSVLGDDPRNALVLCGVCLLCAAASCFLVSENAESGDAEVIGGGGGH
jgi:maltose/moltooligosaccharide transporter